MRSKKAFTLASTFALAGGVVGVASEANAACPTPDPAPTVIPYNNATPAKQACSAADLKSFKDYLAANPNATFKQAETELAKTAAGCASCTSRLTRSRSCARLAASACSCSPRERLTSPSQLRSPRWRR